MQPVQLSGIQVRLARTYLGLTVKEVEMQTGLHKNTLMKAEAGLGTEKTLRALRQFYHEKKIRFIRTDDDRSAGILYEINDEVQLESTKAENS
jgi:transcriptional regulator with XRE-family HTH domain